MTNDVGKASFKNMILNRFIKSTISLLISGAVAYYASNPYFLALQPILAVIGKTAREKGYDFPWF